jgi:hypothetical protein
MEGNASCSIPHAPALCDVAARAHGYGKSPARKGNQAADICCVLALVSWLGAFCPALPATTPNPPPYRFSTPPAGAQITFTSTCRCCNQAGHTSPTPPFFACFSPPHTAVAQPNVQDEDDVEDKVPTSTLKQSPAFPFPAPLHSACCPLGLPKVRHRAQSSSPIKPRHPLACCPMTMPSGVGRLTTLPRALAMHAHAKPSAYTSIATGPPT